MRTFFLLLSFIFSLESWSQDIKTKLEGALKEFSRDTQLSHGILSFYLADAASGEKIYSLNEQLGMAPASVQKIITSATAFDLLGEDYRFETIIGYSGKLKDGIIDGNLLIKASGDPSLGSWRWSSTTRDKILSNIISILKKNKVNVINGELMIESSSFSANPVPNGWIWEDIGNYYGAGAWPLNWYENQYDIHFSSASSINSGTLVSYTSPFNLKPRIRNRVRTAAPGSGDNAIIFTSPFSDDIFTTGTIPAGEADFKVSGAVPDPHILFLSDLDSVLKKASISVRRDKKAAGDTQFTAGLGKLISPSLDSVNYWFLKKSINLYGEALLKKIASVKGQNAGTENGIQVLKDYWSKNGIDASALGMLDGSGLSPGNRITAYSLVQVLLHAQKRPWYQAFHKSLPEMNGISMKDGYITGVRSYAGYIKSNSGKEYCFSFIVNNFQGSAGTIRTKMYKLLDLLK